MLEETCVAGFKTVKHLPNKLEFDRTTSKWWHLWITIKFNKRRDIVTTSFYVTPPINIPHKLRKELSFKTHSYKELCKWLKKNEEKVGIIEE